MDRRTVLAVVLSVAVYYGWLMLRGPELAEQEGAEGATTEQGADVGNEPGTPATTTPEPVAGDGPVPKITPIPEAPAGDLPVRELTFRSCAAQGTVTTNGGVLRDLFLEEHEAPYMTHPLYSWVPGLITGDSQLPWRPYGGEPGQEHVLTEDARALAVGAGPWGSAPPAMEVVSDSPSELVLRGRTEQGIEVTQTLRGNPPAEDGVCTIDVETTWRNTGSDTFAGPLWVAVHDHVATGGGGMLSRYTSTKQPMAYVDGDLEYGGSYGASGCFGAGTQPTEETGPIAVEGPVSWFGVSDRYFGFYVVPNNRELGTAWFSNLGAGDDMLGGAHVEIPATLAPGATHAESFRAYVGPNDRDVLAMVDADLAEAIDLGWFSFFGYPLLWLLNVFHAGVGNWGVSIILLTLLVKLLFFPMTQRSFKSMQKMQKIQPELQKIREEYADNPQEMNQKTFAVMQEHQVNPLSGCLPMFIQFPVWIALYNVLLTSTDLYHTQFLYLKDLSEPDPYCILPIGVMVMMLLQQRFSTSPNMDPVQQRVMKLMPLFFGLLFFAFPSGLAVYVFVNMTLSILQQWLIKRSIDEDDGNGMASPAAATAK